MPRYRRSLFIFRRDLRLQDNTALTEALRLSDEVRLMFILDPRQIDPSANPYHSANAVQFMYRSLRELQREVGKHKGHLQICSGKADEALRTLLLQEEIDAVFVNRDYTRFARQRDSELKACCEGLRREFYALHDTLLQPPESVLKGNGSPYTVFTPFFRKSSQLPVRPPAAAGALRRVAAQSACPELPLLPGEIANLQVKGGRKEGMTLLRRALERLRDYSAVRDVPAERGTSLLSAHLKFGTVSVREVYDGFRERFGADHPFLRQLYWRDFFTHIAFHFPQVFSGCFHRRYDGLAWENDQGKFEQWTSGLTGFPIVDAGMRQLNVTGWMHNRLRMIVASFLTKDLLIDWRWGEQYFARRLVDYDPAVNNGNWQWAASTGCDAQPYFRVYNPWLQQKKFDPECRYIKRWVPELAALPPRQIHGLVEGKGTATYPAPMIDHQDAKDRVEDFYGSVS